MEHQSDKYVEINRIFSKIFLPYISESDYETVVAANFDRYINEAFTTKMFDPVTNYEMLEQRGDAAFNHFIKNYFHWRFPQWQCASGVSKVSRITANYIEGENQSAVAQRLEFPKLIRRNLESDKMVKKLYEDVFEAFIGLTEELFEKKYGRGTGFVVICSILTPIYDSIDVSIDYEQIYDAKTRLKELVDQHPFVGEIRYEDDDQSKITNLYFVNRSSGEKTLIATTTGIKKSKGSDSRHKKAAAIALEYLASKGIKPKKSVQQEFELTCEA